MIGRIRSNPRLKSRGLRSLAGFAGEPREYAGISYAPHLFVFINIRAMRGRFSE